MSGVTFLIHSPYRPARPLLPDHLAITTACITSRTKLLVWRHSNSATSPSAQPRAVGRIQIAHGPFAGRSELGSVDRGLAAERARHALCGAGTPARDVDEYPAELRAPAQRAQAEAIARLLQTSTLFAEPTRPRAPHAARARVARTGTSPCCSSETRRRARRAALPPSIWTEGLESYPPSSTGPRPAGHGLGRAFVQSAIEARALARGDYMSSHERARSRRAGLYESLGFRTARASPTDR